MKQYLYLLSCYILFLVIFFLLVMEGQWFDFENLLKREDVEFYHIPAWQYVAYNFTFFAGIILFIFLFIKYFKYASSPIIELINFIVCALLFLILVLVFLISFVTI